MHLLGVIASVALIADAATRKVSVEPGFTGIDRFTIRRRDLPSHLATSIPEPLADGSYFIDVTATGINGRSVTKSCGFTLLPTQAGAPRILISTAGSYPLEGVRLFSIR